MASTFSEDIWHGPAVKRPRQQLKLASIGSSQDIELLRWLISLESPCPKSNPATLRPGSVLATASSGAHNPTPSTATLSGLQIDVLRELLYRRNSQYSSQLPSGHERLEILRCAVEPQRLAVNCRPSADSAGECILSTATSDLSSWMPFNSEGVCKESPSSGSRIGILLLGLVSPCDQRPPELELDVSDQNPTISKSPQQLHKFPTPTTQSNDGPLLRNNGFNMEFPLLQRRANTWPEERKRRGSDARHRGQSDYIPAWESLKWKRRHLLAMLVWIDALELNPKGAASSVLQYERTWLSFASVMDESALPLPPNPCQLLTMDDNNCGITDRPSGGGAPTGGRGTTGEASRTASFNNVGSSSRSGQDPKRRRVDDGNGDGTGDGDENAWGKGEPYTPDPSPDGNHECPAAESKNCRKQGSYGTLFKHLREKHALIVCKQTEGNRKAPKFAKRCETDVDGGSSKCEECKTEAGLLRNRIDPRHEGPSICLFCWEAFNTRDKLLEHIKTNREGAKCTGKEGSLKESEKLSRLRDLFLPSRLSSPSPGSNRVAATRNSIPVEQGQPNRLAPAAGRPQGRLLMPQPGDTTPWSQNYTSKKDATIGHLSDHLTHVKNQLVKAEQKIEDLTKRLDQETKQKDFFHQELEKIKRNDPRQFHLSPLPNQTLGQQLAANSSYDAPIYAQAGASSEGAVMENPENSMHFEPYSDFSSYQTMASSHDFQSTNVTSTTPSSRYTNSEPGFAFSPPHVEDYGPYRQRQ